VRSSLASLILYSLERISDTTNTSRFDQRVIDVGAIGQQHIGEGAVI
jgi:hypothetical protein